MPKSKAPAQTFEEPVYLHRLAEQHTPVCVKLVSNEEIQGYIEYYDADFIRVTQADGPNLFIYKHEIKYVMDLGPKAAAHGEDGDELSAGDDESADDDGTEDGDEDLDGSE